MEYFEANWRDQLNREVVVVAYWIFKVNPEYYRIDDRLADPEVRITWKVSRYRDRIRAGDTAFIWRTGRSRGICATLKISSDPVDMAEIESEEPYCTPLDTGIRKRVLGELIERFPVIPADKIRLIPGLQGLSVFHGYQQTTNFPVTEEEGRILDALVANAAKR
jgi:predicted RNA-binding protein with PUA-like domain